MASESAKKSQYEYRIADRSLIDRRPRDEPTGEVISLVGKLGTYKMGDRFERSKIEKTEKTKRKMIDPFETTGGEKRKKTKHNENDFEALSGVFYRPKTSETKKTYDVLLNFILSMLGDQPRDILHGAADEILAVIKDEVMKDIEKRKEVNGLLGDLSDDKYAMLLGVCNKLTDYGMENDINIDEDLMGDNYGVTVQVEDEENEDEEQIDRPQTEVDDVDMDEEEYKSDEEDEKDKSDNGDENFEEKEDRKKPKPKLPPPVETVIQGNLLSRDNDNPDKLNVWEIDAYWLQRELNKFYSDAELSHKKAEEASVDNRDLENRLMVLLGHDKFSLIRKIRLNKDSVLYCTLLAAAQTEEDKHEIEKIMIQKPELALILDLLKENEESNVVKEERDRKAAERRNKANENLDENDLKNDSKLRILDIERLAFKEGSHLMTNKKCMLPTGSFRRQKKGYEEVHIPFQKAIVPDNEKLVSIKSLPAYCQQGFLGYKNLNRIQSRISDSALNSSENLLICAPTGSGKTNVAILCMLKEISSRWDESTGRLSSSDFKIIYIAPMKSLVQEMVLNFSKRLGSYGVVVSEMTGDHQLNKSQIEASHIIICTPEKWDIVSRKSGEKAFMRFVSLLIVDEIHLLHDERGPVLEAVIARVLRHSEAMQQSIRIVGLSATLPNYHDVAAFIRVNPDTGLHYFDNSFRPVPLQQEFIGLTEKKALKRFQLSNEIIYEKVMERAGKSQVLIFVHSRKETAKTAKFLRDACLERETLGQFIVDGSASAEVLRSESEQTKNNDLKDLLPFGIAIHHAGMSKVDRTLVEDLFADGHIQVLVSTATLAWGVNLPAHTVIIKGTQVYNPAKGKWCELSSLDVLQMLGRAGRPQYDSKGEGILITTHTELQYYLSLLNHQLPVESQMIERLADNLNSEIVAGTVENMTDAATWMTYTYLFIRMLKNPALYGASITDLKLDPFFQQRRNNLVHSAAALLEKHNLIKYDRKSGSMQSTELGRIASHFYCSYESISTYNKLLRPLLSEIELFRVFSLSNEFKYIIVREEEKVELQQLLERVPIPVKESIDEPSAKVNILLQAYISQLRLDGFALMSDMTYITQSAGRLFRAIFEMCLLKGWAQLAEKCLNLCKMVDKRMWLSMSPLRQFKKLPMEVVKKLEKKDFPWDRLYDLEPSEIGELINAPKMGKILHKYIHHFPKLELSAHVLPISRSTLRVELTISPDFDWDPTLHGAIEPFYITVEDVDREKILHYEYFLLKSKYTNEEHVVKFFIPLHEPLSPHYFIRVFSDRWLHAETELPISFTNLIIPERNLPPTELLDLQPLPLVSLKNQLFESLLSFPYFNPIQTQVFNALYNSDENILISAPPGSGKTTCADLAVMRFISKMSKDKCVYITPSLEQAQIVYKKWKNSFENKIGIPIVLLTGDTSSDVKLLASGYIIITTAEFWDAISRRWKQRKNVQAVSLVIVDDLHLIGGDHGPIIEVGLSRVRYMASQIEKQIRIVALSSSVANAKDLSHWLGISMSNTFNFHQNSRPVPLEFKIIGFNLANYNTRQMAMLQPVLRTVCEYPSSIMTGGYNGTNEMKTTIVFVSSRKETLALCLDISLLLNSRGFSMNATYPQIKHENIELMINSIKDKYVKDFISVGVAFVNESMHKRDREIIHDMFDLGILHTIVVTRTLCWEITAQSYHVVIMDTQYYDGRIHSYAEYPLTDVLRMMGRASRPLIDSIGKVTVLCESSKRNLYKKFLSEPLPIESHLDHCLHDHFNAEVVTKTIETKQDAVDYLTWTFMYRRMTQNPNYYSLQGITHRHLSDNLSELVENTLNALAESKCIIIEDDMDTIPINLGMISAYYYINYFTIELFGASLTINTKQRGLIEIISSAVEFDDITIRRKEEQFLRNAALRLPYRISSSSKYNDPHVKVNILLQEYLSRSSLTHELFIDAQTIVSKCLKLSQACVDVMSSNGWLTSAICAMELCQMITQATWSKDSVLFQIPHFDKDLVEKCTSSGIESIFDLLDMEDADRVKLLSIPESKMVDVARFCNQYPSIEMNYTVLNDNPDGKYIFSTDHPIQITLNFERDEDQTANVIAPYFPFQRQEAWWLVVGIPKKNQLLLIKKLNIIKSQEQNFEFSIGDVGSHNVFIYLISDSYLGCDQEYNFNVDIVETEKQDLQ